MLSKQIINIFVTLFFLSIVVIVLPTAVTAQQASMVWDEASKSWISAPAAPAATPTPTTTPTVPQPQQPQQLPPPQTIIQQQPPIPVVAGQSTVDLGTLATVITPILAGIAGIFLKTRKDMEKKDEEVQKNTVSAINQALEPKLKQITPVAEQTAKQSVQLNQLAEELYKIMAEKANDIKDKPEIQQQKLLEDQIRSKIIAEQAKEASSSSAPSMVWDEKTKSWISK